MNHYIGYFIGALIAVPIGALIAKYATGWTSGFRPRYWRALLSTTIAYVAVNVIGLLFYRLGTFESYSFGLQLLIGWGTLACSHIYLLRSDQGERLTLGKSMIVAICQILGAVISLIVVLLIVVALKKVFA